MATINKVDKLPSGWRWVKLTDLLVALETGSRPQGGAIGVFDGIPSISAEHMTERGVFDFSIMRYVPLEFYNEMNRGHIQVGDILIVKDGATTGKTCFVDETFPFKKAVINEHVFICRPNRELVEPHFLFYWLWGTEGQSLIRSTFQGAAIGGINRSFAELLIPLPPLSEQKRIAKILKEQLKAVDKARIAAEEQIKAAKSLRAGCLREEFSYERAKGWDSINIGNLSTLVVDGPHVTPSYVAGGIPFLTVKNIITRQIDLSEVSYITDDDHKEFCRRGKAEAGDILYTKDGTLGIPCVVDTNQIFSFFVSVALIKLRKNLVDANFVAYALESPFVLKQVERLGSGAGLKHMVLKSINALEIPCPSLDLQTKIASSLKTKFKKIEMLSGLLTSQRITINTLPASLLKKAFRGEL